ncbi:MAG TPA: NAD(P)H-binding protein [Candidatus Saccharimonadales bacterium]|nr:NAD(P)H-binding protein [Candidatus Saccharimonadales bacterium]
MNIAVIAADGRSGQVFVTAALAAGHTVRAGVHGTNSLTAHPHLTVVPCDATNEADLTRLLQGQDAVASFIGHVKGSAADVQTNAIAKVITVMQQLGLRRIVSLTGTGVRSAGDSVPLIDRILNLSIGIIDPARIRDGKNHATALQQSNLEWTIIRVLKLQNVPPKPFQLREHGPTKWYVGRQEVAQAVLQVLQDHSFIGQMPIICKPTTDG